MTPDPINLSATMNQNCQLFVGEDKVITVDMTGYDLANLTTIEWSLALSPFSVDPDILIKKSQSAGITVGSTSIDIAIDAIDTAGMRPELYYHELKIVEADGKIKVAMTGNIIVRMSLNMGGV
jgi:hypothetical protein